MFDIIIYSFFRQAPKKELQIPVKIEDVKNFEHPNDALEFHSKVVTSTNSNQGYEKNKIYKNKEMHNNKRWVYPECYICNNAYILKLGEMARL